jgi:hypothetical protein
VASGKGRDGKRKELPILSRATLRARVISESQRALATAIRSLAGQTVTLALDSGTIWHRYFAVVALAPGRSPLLVAITPDVVFGQNTPTAGKLTGENVARYLHSLMQNELRDVHVAAIVADNAANLQLAVKIVVGPLAGDDAAAAAAPLVANLDPDDFPLEGGFAVPMRDDDHRTRLPLSVRILPQRCFAHALQLVVRDLLGPFGNPGDAPFAAYVNVMMQYKSMWESRVVATRWNSVYLALKDHLLQKSSPEEGRD